MYLTVRLTFSNHKFLRPLDSKLSFLLIFAKHNLKKTNKSLNQSARFGLQSVECTVYVHTQTNGLNVTA